MGEYQNQNINYQCIRSAFVLFPDPEEAITMTLHCAQQHLHRYAHHWKTQQMYAALDNNERIMFCNSNCENLRWKGISYDFDFSLNSSFLWSLQLQFILDPCYMFNGWVCNHRPWGRSGHYLCIMDDDCLYMGSTIAISIFSSSVIYKHFWNNQFCFICHSDWETGRP